MSVLRGVAGLIKVSPKELAESSGNNLVRQREETDVKGRPNKEEDSLNC